MRRAVGAAFLVAGVVLALVGIAVACVFGPDSEVSTGPHELASDGFALVTAPSMLGYAGPTVEVELETVDARQRIFVGLANDSDVQEYLARTSYTRVDHLSLPWDLSMTDVPGDDVPTDPPQDLDWWLVSDQGRGSARIAFRLPDASVDIMAIDPDLQSGVRVELTATLLQRGAFAGALAFVVIGAGLAMSGWLVSRSKPRRFARR